MYSYSQYQQGNGDEKKDDLNQKIKLKPLRWTKALKRGKTNTEIFIWGKARPHNV